MMNKLQTAPPLASQPRQDGFQMPAEWAPQQAVWMIWPYRPDNWRRQGRPAQQAFAEVARAISEVTPVLMAVPEEELAQARTVMPAAVTLVPLGSDDAWMRDVGPTLVRNAGGELRGVDWIFNAWGGLRDGLYHPWDRDQLVAAAVLAYHGLPRYRAPLVLEGGAIHVDGEGTLLTTEECLLNANRNPQLSRKQIEGYLADYLGIDKVLWLPQGVFEDETDGHVDNLACFARPGEVILSWTDDREDPQYCRSQAAYEVLSKATDARGRKLKIWKLHQPGPLFMHADEAEGIHTGTGVPRRAEERLAASYVNFLITNGRLIFPLLDRHRDDQAKTQLQAIFPELEVIGVSAREILLGGGNIHCITQQIPA